jgi:carbon storage regulator
MLVLSRRETQRIKLGKSIVVTVVRVTGDKVRLGIEAPPDVLILREELDPHQTSGAIEEEEETLTAGQMDPLAAVAARSA